jgi:ubiquinone/menaquinone biosynthesis C-methylase UbiE
MPAIGPERARTSSSERAADIRPAASPGAARVWNDVIASKYDAFEVVMVESAQSHGDRVWDDLPDEASSLVVDLGCAFGDATRQLAARYPRASVVGIDCSELLLQRARSRHGQVRNLDFVLADAGRYAPPGPVDLCFSRFGLMFFERPVSALRHVRSWLRSGGTLSALVWQSSEKNPWITLARDVVLRHVPPVNDGAPNCGPGPFSMADLDTTTAILEAAGFRELRFRSVEAPVCIGDSAQSAANLQLALGPAGEIMRHAQDLGHSGVEAARADVVRALESHVTPAGVWLPSASWLITATVPES